MYIRQGNGILKMYKTAVLSDKKLQDTFAQIAHRLYTTNLVLQTSLDQIPVFNAKDYERLFETFFEKMVHGRFEDHCQYKKQKRRQEGFVANVFSYREEQKAISKLPKPKK